jgi:spore coat polysaccharide biosynthesis protein SpsF (cytidylyltransferase family)
VTPEADTAEELPGRIPAIVLAGGKTTPEFAAEAGLSAATGIRALAEINGQPMVRYVLRALKESRTIDRVLLAAPSGFPDQPEAAERVIADGDLAGNIALSLEKCPGAEHVLLVTADIPFVTPAAVDDYVHRSVATGADCFAQDE